MHAPMLPDLVLRLAFLEAVTRMRLERFVPNVLFFSARMRLNVLQSCIRFKLGRP